MSILILTLDNFDLKNISQVPNSEKLEKKPDFSFLHQYNALGLRGKLPNSNAAQNIWIGLGDSFTEGVGAPEDSTWPALLTKYCNETDSIPVFCVNAGHSGSDPFDAFYTLQRLLTHYAPQRVILSINQTDLGDIITKGGLERFDPYNTTYMDASPWWEPFYAFSFICRNIIHASTDINYNLRTQNEQVILEKIAEDKLYNLIVKDYKILSDKHGFKLSIVFHPSEEELKIGALTNESLYNRLALIDDANLINLIPHFREFCMISNKPFSSLYWKIDRHYKPQGYALWAKVLCDSLHIQKHINSKDE